MKIARARFADQFRYGLIEDGAFLPLRDDPFHGLERTGEELGIDELQLLNPVEPRRVLVILGGFLQDGESAVPDGAEPRLFPKVVTHHLGPETVIPRPPFLTGPLEMESEIALVVGRELYDATPEQAWEAILGFTCYNDVTAGEFVPADLYRAKSLDGFSVLGPWVSTDLTRADIAAGLTISGRVNGEVCHSASTSRFKFDPGQVLSFASRFVTMLPGDVIALGTPPRPYAVNPGDVLEVDVEGLGVLRNIAG